MYLFIAASLIKRHIKVEGMLFDVLGQVNLQPELLKQLMLLNFSHNHCGDVSYVHNILFTFLEFLLTEGSLSNNHRHLLRLLHHKFR